MGHPEYDRNTLKEEYMRDREKGDNVDIPQNYFVDNDINSTPKFTWRGSSNIIFGNWLNYCVYQNTPYDINDISK